LVRRRQGLEGTRQVLELKAPGTKTWRCWPGRELGRVRERLLGLGTDVIDIEEEIWGAVSRFRS